MPSFGKSTTEKNSQVPHLEDYLVNRKYSGGILLVFDLIEAVEGIYLPTEVRNTYIRSLVSMANNIGLWTNDMLSLQRELALGDVHNLVVVLQHHHQIPIQEALDRAMEMHDLEVKKYLELEKRLYEQKKPYENELKKINDWSSICLRGNLDWSMMTGRYQITSQ